MNCGFMELNTSVTCEGRGRDTPESRPGAWAASTVGLSRSLGRKEHGELSPAARRCPRTQCAGLQRSAWEPLTGDPQGKPRGYGWQGPPSLGHRPSFKSPLLFTLIKSNHTNFETKGHLSPGVTDGNLTCTVLRSEDRHKTVMTVAEWAKVNKTACKRTALLASSANSFLSPSVPPAGGLGGSWALAVVSCTGAGTCGVLFKGRTTALKSVPRG